MEQKAGTSATFSILCAVASFIMTFAGHPLWGLFAALAAIPLGVIGLVVATSPRVGGGIMSMGAIFLAVLAIGAAILGMIGVIVF